MGAVITLAGENLIAQKQAANTGLKISRFLFANVPGLNPTVPVDRAAPKPVSGQIVYTHQIPPEHVGYVNPNQVVYSAQIGSDVGDWDFNWIGLETTEGVLFAVAYVPVQQKRRNIPPQQVGNNLTRNFLVAFDGAQSLTGITIDAKTWQHDFTVRLAGIDERARKANRDLYGRRVCLNNGLQMEKVGNVYQLKPGIAYIEGVRVELTAPLPFPAPTSFPVYAWLDVSLQRQLSDVAVTLQTAYAYPSRVDYVDGNGIAHHSVIMAEFPDANTLVDRRITVDTSGALVMDFALKTGDYANLRARATTKDDVGLGNLPNAKSDDPAVNDSNVLATTKMVRAALDQLDWKNSVLFTTTAPVVLSGLVVQAGGDWATVLPPKTRVLVKDQEDRATNGIYESAAGSWTRSTDADESLEVTPGMFVYVEHGAALSDSFWRLTTSGSVTLGTTPLTFEMEAGRMGAAGGTYDLLTINSRGQVVGGSRQKVTPAVTVDTALSASHRGLVLLDASAGNRVITLPPSTPALGVIDVLVRRADNTTNRLTVQASGPDKIRFHTHLAPAGYSFFYLMGAGDWWHLRSDSAGNWWPIGRLDSSPLGRPTFETTTAFHPGGNGPLGGVIYNRAEWPWLWDHAQASGMIVAESQRVGLEGSWTSGDGVATFRGPDGRNEFMRVLDEGRGIAVVTFPGNVVAGSKVISGVIFTGVNLAVGMPIAGNGIPAGNTVAAFDRAAGTVTLTSNATASVNNSAMTATGRVPGSRQNGSVMYSDMDGVGGYGLASPPAPIQPRTTRDDIGWDVATMADYPVDIGVSAGAPAGGIISLANSPQYFGVSRPRNIAFPGRMKLI